MASTTTFHLRRNVFVNNAVMSVIVTMASVVPKLDPLRVMGVEPAVGPLEGLTREIAGAL